MALGYSGGSLIAYVGSRVGDKIGHRRLAIAGNLAIPLLSLSALFASPPAAVGFFCGGWWARNLRTPSRRVMLQRSTVEVTRTKAFGFLHSLDIGGGILSAIYLLVSLALNVPYEYIFLGTIVPLVISTICLTTTSPELDPIINNERVDSNDATEPYKKRTSQIPSLPKSASGAMLAATLLFGFSSYSIGFPVLTAAKEAHDVALGVVAFLLFNTVSSMTGLLGVRFLGRSWKTRFHNLGLLGYLPAALGAGLLGVAAGAGLGYGVVLGAVVILGIALGIVETLEPSLMSVIRPEGGRGFGLLSAYRSAGLFIGNLAMGLLYTLGADWSYGYAAIVAFAGATILLIASSLPKIKGS